MDIKPQMGGTTATNNTDDIQTHVNDVNVVSNPTDESEAPQIMGLSEEEVKDPNAISITIADRSNPIVVLFGPPACG